MTEKHQKTFSDSVNDVPEGFPALLRAEKVVKRTGKGGWKDSYEAAEEALFAAEKRLAAAEGGNTDEALGELLLAAVRLGKLKGGDAEQALLDKVKAVQREYTAFEALVLADGKDVNALSPEERKEYERRRMRAFDGAGGVLPEGAQEGGVLCAVNASQEDAATCGAPFKPLSFAGLTLPNNVLLAPMAGYTDLAYRRMCIRLGAGLTFTEMVSSKGLLYDNAETKKLLRCGEESPKAAQLFGSDPDILRTACESELLAPYDLIDLNMGCPMPKIVRNGEGSALLEKMPLAEKVISACAKSGKRISVKFRTGVKEGDNVAAEFAKLCEGAGACLVTVHGRVRERIYAGEPDYSAIAEAKNAVKISVIANGGVWNKKDAEKMLQRTGADGVMVARAALYRPQTFSDILGTPAPSMRELFFPLLDEEITLNGERFALLFLRKMAAFWCKGVRGAAEYKRRLFAADSIETLRLIAEELFG